MGPGTFDQRRATLAALALAGVWAAAALAQAQASIILATTTSTQDSGLLDILVPRFEQRRGIEVKVIAVGTGAALRMAASGNADVVLVHAPASERTYVEAGDLVEGRLVMHNDFVIVGPRGDPAGVGRERTAADAMRAIAARGTFISRGEESGTHTQELALWATAGINPRTLARREETGQGMGATLSVADQKGAYALTDRGTYLAQRARLSLAVLFQGDTSLRNVYHVYAVNPAKHPKTKLTEARQFIDFLVSPAVQRAIGEFKRDQFRRILVFSRCGRPALAAHTLRGSCDSDDQSPDGIERVDEIIDETHWTRGRLLGDAPGMPETFSKRLLTAGLVAGSCFGAWFLGSTSASAQQPNPTSTQPESTSPAETPDRSHVFDMGEIVVVGTPDGQPTVRRRRF